MPYGKYFTLSVIETRNKLLQDSALNLPIPQGTATLTETSVLDTLISEASTTIGSGAKSLYYPAFSQAYAYQPTQKEGLKDEFKAHNWFLPTMGEIMRFGYYISKGTTASDIGKEEAVLAKAMSKGILSNFSTYYYRCSGEIDSTNTVIIRFLSSLRVTASLKSVDYDIRYICAF